MMRRSWLAAVLLVSVSGAVLCGQSTPPALPAPRLISLTVNRGASFTRLQCDTNGGVFAEGNGTRFSACRASTNAAQGLRELYAALQRAGVETLKPLYGEPSGGEEEEVLLRVADEQKERTTRCVAASARPQALLAIMDLLIAAGRAWPEAPTGSYVVVENVEAPMPLADLLTGLPMRKFQFLANLGTAFPAIESREWVRWPAIRHALARAGLPCRVRLPEDLPAGVSVASGSGWAGLMSEGVHYGLRLFTWEPTKP
jgi:hypothetical protein